MCDNEEQNYPLEFINSLTPSGMPEHRLFLQSWINYHASMKCIQWPM